jgi:hypothetical protein
MEMLMFLAPNPDYGNMVPVPLRISGNRVSDRKLQLFACACRRQYAEYEWVPSNDWTLCEEDGHHLPTQGHSDALLFCNPNSYGTDFELLPLCASILRDIAGNPFRPFRWPECGDCRGTGDETSDGQGTCGTCKGVGRSPGPWLTPLVISLGDAAYKERLEDGCLDQERLFVLSDAAEEAGCSSSELLCCLRKPGRKYRGLWALDVILGKE